MKKDYTHITLILDRSGSMESIRTDTIGGINTFLETQKGEPGEATVTLVQFDTQDPYEVIERFRPVKDVSPLTLATYVPRGMTPLLDALGRGINDIEEGISNLEEEDKPSKVIVAIITDGEENSSHEFKKEQIVKMITEKTTKNDWQFLYLSADLNAFDDAMKLGFAPQRSMKYEKSGDGVTYCMSALSEGVSEFRRSQSKKDISFEKKKRKTID